MKATAIVMTLMVLTAAAPVAGRPGAQADAASPQSDPEPSGAEAATPPATAPSFSNLRFLRDALLSTHAVKLALRQPNAFVPAGPVHHTPTFNGHPFQVSLAAYVARDRVIMVHAERLTDGSGALDYSGLEPATLSGMDFNFRDVCAPLDDKEIAEEHDLRFLADSGFDPKPALFLRQFFMTSPDHNAEYVLSYGTRVDGCGLDVVTPEFIDRMESEIKALIDLEPAP